MFKNRKRLITENTKLKRKLKSLLTEDYEYNPIVFHGTDYDFEKFDDSKPIFFVDSEKVAKSYGDIIKKVELDFENPVIFDFEGKSTVYFDGKWQRPSQLANIIKEIYEWERDYNSVDDEIYDELEHYEHSRNNGDIDGLIMDNIDDSKNDLFGFDETATNYIVFDESKIKYL